VRMPILEANTLRLFSRLLAYRGDPASAAGGRLLWAMAEAVLPRRDAGRFNQALMELGSQLCTVRAPRCGQCPVAALCRAHAEGIEAKIPPPKVKPPPQQRHEAAAIIRRQDRVLLVRCAEGGRWAGLWDFPRCAVENEHPLAIHRELKDHVRREHGIVIAPGAHLKTLRHSVTRFHITLECYEAACVSGPEGAMDPSRVRWLTAAELDAYPLSSTGRRLSRLAGS